MEILAFVEEMVSKLLTATFGLIQPFERWVRQTDLPWVTWVIVGIIVLLISLFISLAEKDTRLVEAAMWFEVEMGFAFLWNNCALAVGIAASRQSVEAVVTNLLFSSPHYLNNFGNWGIMGKIMIYVAIVGVILKSIYYIVGRRGLGKLLASCMVMIAAAVLGTAWVALRVWLGHMGGLAVLPVIAMGFLEGVLFALWPGCIIICLLIPKGILVQIGREREEREKAKMKRPLSKEERQQEADSESFHSVQEMPQVITGPYGKTYHLLNMHIYSAEYSEGGTIVEIHNSDIGPTGRSAKNASGYFYW